MGLNITAYAKVTLVRAMGVKDYNKNDDARALVAKVDHCYLYQDGDRAQSDGMPDGVYAVSVASFRFDAGSYGGYNAWRNQLSEMMLDMTDEQVWETAETAKESLAGRPFVELIDFSDCEGFIGPKTCAKLSADFAANQEKANACHSEFRARYADWQKAFALASGGGVVRFH